MGRYIETDAAHGKADFLVQNHGAELLGKQPESFAEIPKGKVLICVADNGPFEAAAVCYDQIEFDRYIELDDLGPSTIESGPDAVKITIRSAYQEMGMQRPKWWLFLDRDNPIVVRALEGIV